MVLGGLVLGLVNSHGNHSIKQNPVCQHRLPHKPGDFLKLLHSTHYPQHFFFNCGTVCLQWAAQTITLTESCHKQSFKVKQKWWNWNVCPKKKSKLCTCQNETIVLQSHLHFLGRLIHRSEPRCSPSPVSEAILAWQLSLSDAPVSSAASPAALTHGRGIWCMSLVQGRANSDSARQSALWDTREQQVTSDLVCNYFVVLYLKPFWGLCWPWLGEKEELLLLQGEWGMMPELMEG